MKCNMKLSQLTFFGLVFGLIFSELASATTGDLTTMSNTIKAQAIAVATLLNVSAYVAGVGFAFAGILQFKAHKDNPQQTPLSKAVVMVVVSACLLFLPTVMQVAGSSLFGNNGTQAIQYKSPMNGL